MARKKGKIIGVVSAGGGVGKTTTVANLGVTIAKEFNKDILVLDGNISTANLGLHLGLVYPPVTLHDVLKDKISIIQAIYVHESGLHVVPSSLGLDMDVNPVYLGRKIERLKDRYDLILIDSAPGLSKEVLNVMKAVDGLLIMTTPDIASIVTSLKLIDLARKMKVSIIGLVLNMIRKKSYELREDDIVNSLEVPVIAKIPDDEKIPEAVAVKMPVVLYDPLSPASIAFKKLAAHLIEEKYEPPGIWYRIKSLFSRKQEGRFLKNKDERLLKPT